jgi:hypothetical protein
MVMALYLYLKGPAMRPRKLFTKEEVIMLLSEAIANFMEYQKVNSGKKYGQELPAFPGQGEFPF